MIDCIFVKVGSVMSKSISKCLKAISLSAMSIGMLFSNAHAEGPMQAGQMIVQLYGMIDLDDEVPEGTPHLLDARMMGATSITMGPPEYGIYTQRPEYYPNTTSTLNNREWDDEFAIVGISDYSGRCRAETFNASEHTVLGQGKKFAFKMKHTDASGLFAWVVPSFKVDINLNLPNGTQGLKTSYSGVLGEPIANLKSIDPKKTQGLNLCYIPPGKITIGYGGTKHVQFSIAKPLEVYLNGKAVPGDFIMDNSAFRLVSLGGHKGFRADGEIKVRFITNVKIARVCRISAASGTVFHETFGRADSIPLESRLTFNCSGQGNPLYMSAIPRMGEAKGDNLTKLELEQIDSGEKSTVKPWVIGAPYFDGGNIPALSCDATNQSNLIKFDNSDIPLNKNAQAENDNLNIRWLMCKNRDVKPGKYKGRVELLVYTKV
ncbi:hypothetical protein ABVE63_002674 [Providencia stuartii]|nr:hypothetical protein BGK56_11365 [Providencia stuartii]AVL38543.1 hypothetical protein CEP70_00300 [Providencia stuartii]EMF0919218.1 hypothetical protein [Providencia stuartii]KSX96579.1 hypothetical protein APT95_12880 [Providencia stuartii]MBG5905106.1 hypothetical protein [Providencia stuartii]